MKKKIGDFTFFDFLKICGPCNKSCPLHELEIWCGDVRDALVNLKDLEKEIDVSDCADQTPSCNCPRATISGENNGYCEFFSDGDNGDKCRYGEI